VRGLANLAWIERAESGAVAVADIYLSNSLRCYSTTIRGSPAKPLRFRAPA